VKPKHAWMSVGVVALALGGLSAPAAGAATVKVANGAVVFTAAPGEVNDVQSRPGRSPLAELTITDAGAPVTARAGCTQVDAHTATCPQPPSVLTITTGDGDDRVFVDEDGGLSGLTVNGGIGNDVLLIGSGVGFSPALDGGSGDDQLVVSNNGGGTPVMHGGGGNDSLSVPESGGGLMYGDDGNDTLEFAATGTAELHGGNGADQLILTDSNLFLPPMLNGEGGADTYSFPSERRFLPETIVPSPGTDTLDQTEGEFPIDFSAATCPGCVETVIGSEFDDHIVGDGSAQTILGGSGADTLDGGGGADVLSGQTGDDSIISRDADRDSVSCDGGIDAVIADRLDVVSRACESVDRG
jgi:Ca2+-binding RTX toxin-like protein